MNKALETSIKWLETNREPWEMVVNHWKSTVNYRLNDAQKNRNKPLSDVFEKWPILNHPMGWSLIVEDFKYLELHSTEDSISQWPQFFTNLKKLCPLTKKTIPRVRELLQIIEGDYSDGVFYIILRNYFNAVSNVIVFQMIKFIAFFF